MPNSRPIQKGKCKDKVWRWELLHFLLNSDWIPRLPRLEKHTFYGIEMQ